MVSSRASSPSHPPAPDSGSDPTPARPRGRARAHDHILASTRALLAEVGYDSVTMEGIAARAGTGKQTLYRWWPSRAAVVLDAFLSESTGRRAAAVPHTENLAADLECYLGALARRLGEPSFAGLAHVLTSELLRAGTEGPALVQSIIDEGRSPILDRLRAGADELGTPPEIAADLLAGPLYYRWMLHTGPLDDDFVRASVAAVLATRTD